MSVLRLSAAWIAQNIAPATDAEKARTNGCPDSAKHTASPEGYSSWLAWAARMSKTHLQVRCEGCGLFVIWLRKR